jgi:hypothetical protein
MLAKAFSSEQAEAEATTTKRLRLLWQPCRRACFERIVFQSGEC